MVKTVGNEVNVFCDFDDTLVHWDELFFQPGDGKVKIIDPYDKSVNYLKPHKKHIRLLKKMKGRGNFIIVWSAGGYKWAEAVVKALKLEDIVDLVMTKPAKYVDDLDASIWIGSRIYLKDDE